MSLQIHTPPELHFTSDPHTTKANFRSSSHRNLHFTSDPHTTKANFRSTHHQSFISLQTLTPPKLISDPYTAESFVSLQTFTPAKLHLTSHSQAFNATFHSTFSPVFFWINSTEFFCLHMYGLWAGGSKHQHSPYQQNLKQNVFKASLPSFPASVHRAYSTLTIPPGPARLVSPIRSRSIWRAAWRPSDMAHTTSDWPRRQSGDKQINESEPAFSWRKEVWIKKQ